MSAEPSSAAGASRPRSDPGARPAGDETSLRLVSGADASESLAFDLADPERRNRCWRLRQRGLDDDSLRFCLAHHDLDRIIERNRGRCRHVVIACAPKSASSYLSEAILEVTGFRRYFLAPLGEDRERQIERRAVPLFLATDTVSQEHLRATGPDVRLLAAMGVRPVVLVRDIFDSLVSLRDQIAADPPARWPMAVIPRGFGDWSRDRQDWFVVRMFTPWYLGFVASWQDAAATLETLVITYEDVVARTGQTIAAVLGHCGIESSPDRIAEGIRRVDRGRIRFNRGVSGRGRDELSPAQQQAVREMAKPFQDAYDLSPLGLATAEPDDLSTMETRA